MFGNDYASWFPVCSSIILVVQGSGGKYVCSYQKIKCRLPRGPRLPDFMKLETKQSVHQVSMKSYSISQIVKRGKCMNKQNNQSHHFSKKSTTSVELNQLNQVLNFSGESWDEAGCPPQRRHQTLPGHRGHLASGGDAKVNLIP